MVSSVPQLRSVHTLVACSPRPGRVDLFVAADNGEVWQKTLDGVSQQPWRSHGRPWPSESLSRFDRLAVTIPASGRIQLFAHRGDTQQLWRTQCEGGRWTGWAPQDPREQVGWLWVAAPPGHVFVVGRDGTLRVSANRLRSATRSSLPAVATPSFANESPYDDDHLRESHPEVDDPLPTLRTPHQLLVSVVPRVRALHYPTFGCLKRSQLAFLRDHGKQAAIL
jgi:hypothetical protein